MKLLPRWAAASYVAGCIARYAIVAQSMPRELTGRAATFLNLLIFIGAFLVQAGFGLVIGLWKPDLLGHAPAQAYQNAFALLVLIQVPGLWNYARRRMSAPLPAT